MAGISGGWPGPIPFNPPVAQELGVGDHTGAVCGSGPCPFVNDVVLNNTNAAQGSNGLWVAAMPDGAALFSGTEDRAFMLRVEDDDAVLNEIWMAVAFSGLAQMQDGRVFLLAGDRVYFDNEPIWMFDTVPVMDGLIGPYDFAIGPDGTRRAWYSREAEVDYVSFTLGGGFGWQLDTVVPENPGTWTQWTTDRDGESVGLGYSFTDTEAQLWAVTGGVATAMGSPTQQDITTVHAAVRPAVPQASSGPSYAAIIQTFEGLTIAWVDAATPSSSSQVAVPETPKLLFSACEPSPHASLCNEDCADEIEGVGAFAATQTSDGDLWLAYTEVTRSFLFDYGAPEGSCDPSSSDCLCSTEMSMKDTSTTLRLLRLRTGTSQLSEVLAMPIAALDHDIWGPMSGGVRVLDARAYGDTLAIGLRGLYEEPESQGDAAPDPEAPVFVSQMRLIELDTTAF